LNYIWKEYVVKSNYEIRYFIKPMVSDKRKFLTCPKFNYKGHRVEEERD
jgi:hypothetical protein